MFHRFYDAYIRDYIDPLRNARSVNYKEAMNYKHGLGCPMEDKEPCTKDIPTNLTSIKRMEIATEKCMSYRNDLPLNKGLRMNDPDSNMKRMYRAYRCFLTRSEFSQNCMKNMENKFILICKIKLERSLSKAYQTKYKIQEDKHKELDRRIVETNNFFGYFIQNLIDQQSFFFIDSLKKLRKLSAKITIDQPEAQKYTHLRILQLESYVQNLRYLRKNPRNIDTLWHMINTRYPNKKKYYSIYFIERKYERDIATKEKELICDLRGHLDHQSPIRIAKGAYHKISEKLDSIWRYIHYDPSVYVYQIYFRDAENRRGYLCDKN